MLRRYILLKIFLVAFISQSNSQSLDNLKEINKIWGKFYQAFDSLDHQPMAEIHSKKLVRISGGERIYDYETYINNYKVGFDEAKKNNVLNNISLRFFERINNDSVASERGIYKLIRIENGENEKIYYGQFHVLFIKENNVWKILMDYDSNEENGIGEEEYTKAYGINEFGQFVRD